MKTSRSSGHLSGLARGLKAGLASLGLVFAALPAHAAAPLAGTVISNQATAVFSNALGSQQSVTSNTVETRVLEKYGFTLTQDNTKYVAPGGTVYLPHTIANNGNASDSFNLRISGLNGSTTKFAATCSVYADANGDGQPDNPSSPLVNSGSCANAFATGQALVLGPVAAGATYKFVVAIQALPTAVVNDSVNFKVDAQSVGDTSQSTSGFGGTASAQNTDTVTVTNVAVFDVVKSVDRATANPGDTVTYTLTVRNTGAAAGTTTISDTIGAGDMASMTYLAGSGRWSSTGATVLTDATGNTEGTDGAGASLDYSFAGTSLSAVLANLAPNAVHTIKFQAVVKAGVQAGTAGSKNKASFDCSGGTCNTNEVVTAINAAYGVVASSATGTTATGADITAGAANGTADENLVATASAGSSVTFTNVIWNTGNAPDSFVISNTSSDFPPGTLIQHLQSDGATPLAGNTTPQIPPGASYNVVTKITLPATASGGPFSLVKLATSLADPNKKDAVKDTVTTVTAATLVLSNDSALTLIGVGAAQTTKTSTNAQPVAFPLFIQSNVPGSFALAASGSNFTAGQLPAGWSVNFFAATGDTTCAAYGSTSISSVNITSTQVSTSTGTHVACAVVTPPAAAPAGTVDFYFRASNSASGLSSVKRDAVTTASVPSLSLQPSNVDQVSPGGSVLYTHVLSNNGNTPLTCSVSPTANNTASGWTSVIYRDTNNNGQLDSNELTPWAGTFDGTNTAGVDKAGNSTAGTLATGEAIRLFVKVFAPSGAAGGTADALELKLAPNGCTTYTSDLIVTDTTTVVTGDLRLFKQQALDATCDGTADAPFSVTQLTAKPGQCVCYQVQATNQGVEGVTGVTLSDATPAYTKLSTAATCTSPASVGTAGTVGSAGTVSCTAATVNPGQSFSMNFCVKVDE